MTKTPNYAAYALLGLLGACVVIVLMLAGAMTAPVYASELSDSTECTTEIRYVIKDGQGEIIDDTGYINNWPGITCKQRIQMKYLTLKRLVEGDAETSMQLLE